MNDFRILFPCETYNIRNIDDCYLAEKNICDRLGIKYFYYDYDIFISEGRFVSNIDFSYKGTIIYRGWMLKPEQYNVLLHTIIQKSSNNIKFINNYNEYTTCHCFPSIYFYLMNYTPKIYCTDITNIINKTDNVSFLYDIISNKVNYDFFLKDDVKSIKNENGIEKINIDSIQLNELIVKINNFIEERGKLFTGSVVFKEFVDLKKFEDNKTNEWRIFYYKDKVICKLQNSYLNTNVSPPDELIEKIGNIIGNKSNFYTVDFALKNNDEWIVIETGDGQVSGLTENKGYELIFYNNLINIL